MWSEDLSNDALYVIQVPCTKTSSDTISSLECSFVNTKWVKVWPLDSHSLWTICNEQIQ